MVIFGGGFEREILINDPFNVMKRNAILGLNFLVPLGVILATLSSALGSYLGAPRILQAVARDRLIKPLAIFARGSARGDEPRNALVFTLIITFGVLAWAGGQQGGQAFNIVASLITMFFLATYGMINLAAFTEARGRNPSFRPQFRCSTGARRCWAGFWAALAVAVLIDPVPAVVAIVIIAGLFWYLRTRQLHVVRRCAPRLCLQPRTAALAAEPAPYDADPKNWRPTVLAFIDTAGERDALIEYSNWLEAGRGILQVVDILKGDPLAPSNSHLVRRGQLARMLQEQDILGFPLVLVADTIPRGIAAALQSASIGPVLPNLAVVGWDKAREDLPAFFDYLSIATRMDVSLVLLKSRGMPRADRGKRIDVWWRGQANGALMLLLAYLLSLNYEWAGSRIRLLRLVEGEEGRGPSLTALRELCAAARVDAEVEVIASSAPFVAALHEHSMGSDCVILGCQLPEEGGEEEWYERFTQLLEGMPTTLVVRAAGDVDVKA